MSESVPAIGDGTSRVLLVILFMTFFSVMGCTTVPEDTRSARVAMLSNPPKELIENVEHTFRKKVALMDAPEINRYLSVVASRLFGPTKDPVSISVVSTTTAGYRPSIWVIPGGKIFVDVRVLRTLRFENELASGIVLAWELAEDMDFRERLIQEGGKADPSVEKVWVYGELETQRAIESAVDRIYKSGYDPRGLVSYFNRTVEKDRTAMNVEASKEKARRTVAFYAPLLNPIVHTEEFHKMKKRLERL